jgi:hypothetical protein
MTLEDVIVDTTRKLSDCIGCGRTVPSYLQKQVDAVYEMEIDFDNGLEHLLNGLIAERDHLKEVLHE